MSRCAPSWHEPPIATLLPDREALTAVIEDMFQTYQREGKGHGMAKFIALISHDGPAPDGFAFPAMDPSQFGLPVVDDGSRDDPLLGQNLRSCTGYRSDVAALRSTSTRLVLARGEGSG